MPASHWAVTGSGAGTSRKQGAPSPSRGRHGHGQSVDEASERHGGQGSVRAERPAPSVRHSVLEPEVRCSQQIDLAAGMWE